MQTGSKPSFALPAHLDPSQAESLLAALMLLPMQPHCILALDASNTESVSAAGAQVLVSFEKSAKAAQTQIALVNPNSTLRQLLQQTGLSCLLNLLTKEA